MFVGSVNRIFFAAKKGRYISKAMKTFLKIAGKEC